MPELGAPIATAAGLIEFGGAVIVTVAVVRAFTALVTGAGIDRARLLVIGGTLGALGFKTAATLLKALEFETWRAVGVFAAIFTLRTVVKRLFLWERRELSKTPSRVQKMQSRLHATMLRDGATNSN